MRAKNRKCKECRKAFLSTAKNATYCSPACRQKAYRRRIERAKGKRKASAPAGEPPLMVGICQHCLGSFWQSNTRQAYCSTSCRTLASRAKRQALPAALADLRGLPLDMAGDLLKAKGLTYWSKVLEAAGYTYVHSRRRWLQSIRVAA